MSSHPKKQDDLSKRTKTMKKHLTLSTLLQFIAVLFSFFFIYTELQKVIYPPIFFQSLAATGLFKAQSISWLAFTSIGVEIIVALLLLSFRRYGFLVGSILLFIYTGYVWLSHTFYFYASYAYGSPYIHLSYEKHMAINIFLLTVLVVATLLDFQQVKRKRPVAYS